MMIQIILFLLYIAWKCLESVYVIMRFLWKFLEAFYMPSVLSFPLKSVSLIKIIVHSTPVLGGARLS